jgi:hypothetical protein
MRVSIPVIASGGVASGDIEALLGAKAHHSARRRHRRPRDLRRPPRSQAAEALADGGLRC